MSSRVPDWLAVFVGGVVGTAARAGLDEVSKASPVRGAAAVAWVICRANESVGYSADLTVAELLAWFGVKGSVSQRAEPMLRANGVDPHDSLNGELGSPALLVSTRRRKIIEVRDRLLEPRDE